MVDPRLHIKLKCSSTIWPWDGSKGIHLLYLIFWGVVGNKEKTGNRFGARELQKDVCRVDPEVLGVLEGYGFPGNVRELENLMERAVTLARGERITVECLPATVVSPEPESGQPRPLSAGGSLVERLAEFEARLLREALEKAGGVKKRAAGLLGVSFRSFRYRLEKLGLESGEKLDGE